MWWWCLMIFLALYILMRPSTLNQEKKEKEKISLYAYYLKKLHCINKSKNQWSWRIVEFKFKRKLDIRHMVDNQPFHPGNSCYLGRAHWRFEILQARKNTKLQLHALHCINSHQHLKVPCIFLNVFLVTCPTVICGNRENWKQKLKQESISVFKINAVYAYASGLFLLLFQ